MNNRPKSLMTHFVEGSIVTRELRDMLSEAAADARIETTLPDVYDRDRQFREGVRLRNRKSK